MPGVAQASLDVASVRLVLALWRMTPDGLPGRRATYLWPKMMTNSMMRSIAGRPHDGAVRPILAAWSFVRGAPASRAPGYA
jgi:hypothetical protein